jgi:predicted dehydrogenase
MEKVKWGIIGCGDVCEVKSGPALYKSEFSELVAVMRRDSEKVQDFAHRHGVASYYTDAKDLINDDRINAIYIATPPAFHLNYTIQAAKARKAVYVEKPMALNFEECKQMIAICEKHKVPLFVAYYRRGLPYFQKVKELLDSGVLGDLMLIDLELIKPKDNREKITAKNWRTQAEISGGGYFYDLASHQIDLLEFLLGPIQNAHGSARNMLKQYSVEDTVTAALEFERGLIGTARWSFTGRPGVRMDELCIRGEKGEIRCSSFNGDRPIELITEEEKTEFSLPYPQHVQQPLIEQIIAQLRGKGEALSTGKTAARANYWMDRIVGKF